MKKLKDFLYDNNDILIAFAILVVAALVIVWRMSAIIEYPKAYIDDNASQISGGTNENSAESAENSSDKNHESEGSNDSGNDSSSGKDNNKDSGNDKGKSNEKDSSAAETKELWVNGTLSRSIEVSVYGNSASAAIQCLIDARLFEDYAEYQSACDSLGIDHQKVSAGSFTFEKGSTKSDIARAVNWS